MSDTLVLLAVATFFGLAALAASSTLLGCRRFEQLQRISAGLEPMPPPVSIIVAARNEEQDIELALRSLLAQDYPAFEIVVVNDRSTDRTGFIIERMAQADRRLKVFNITELPPGWLGKNHAQFTGAQHAQGSILLFTDADVKMAPATLARAVNAMQQGKLDHLVVMPQLTPRGRWLTAMITCFMIIFLLYLRPWKVRDPRSPAHVGVGAFNMVRREAYERAGTHRVIAMRPDDDLKLGKVLKSAGYRADVLLGTGMVQLEWYPSWPAMREGLMKNTFAGLEYNLVLLIALSALSLGVFVLPFIGLVFTGGVVRYVNIASVIVLCSFYAAIARTAGMSPWNAPLFPVTVLAFVYLCWRAAILTLWNDGISWRGTHYRLAALRANKV